MIELDNVKIITIDRYCDNFYISIQLTVDGSLHEFRHVGTVKVCKT
ncbi:hypothetical protein BX659_1094 [Orenia metallireducens]|uniref:Uncharacterized protein n=1 Tax=Orenia metallireducens TaxID=1413210 RepID=A0A285H2A2_9FIRM|nr:hypothetical protein BX659_1094 [Orenia metallireducens]SNY29713.1 hypothetical protein SAMN06265827_1134 [Orenia metallireducens]